MIKRSSMFFPQESLNGDMKEMIKFTYDLKCFKDALDIKVFISVFKDYSGTKFTLIDISFTFCRNSILRKSPWKQKQRRITVRVKKAYHMGKDLDHNGHDVNGDDDHDYDDNDDDDSHRHHIFHLIREQGLPGREGP